MKLALLRRNFSPTGGAELYLQRLIKALLAKGHALTLFCESWREPPAGLDVCELPVGGSRASKPLLFAQAVQDQLQSGKFNCVFSLERCLGADVYRAGDGVHRVWLERRNRFSPWWRKCLTRFSQFHQNMLALEGHMFDPARTRRVIVNSDMVRREILEHFPFPRERIDLVRNGIEMARFTRGQRAETRGRFGLAPGDYVLLFVGSGWERKGLRFLNEALWRLEQRSGKPLESLKLLVAGKGKPPRDAHPNIIFAGPCEDVENLYAAADLFTLVPIYEPSANVCFEAWAAGLPVVTSSWNGAAELVVETENGTVIEDPGDIDTIARAIARWQVRGQIRVTPPPGLDLDRNVNETIGILEKAAAQPSP